MPMFISFRTQDTKFLNTITIKSVLVLSDFGFCKFLTINSFKARVEEKKSLMASLCLEQLRTKPLSLKQANESQEFLKQKSGYCRTSSKVFS